LLIADQKRVAQKSKAVASRGVLSSGPVLSGGLPLLFDATQIVRRAFAMLARLFHERRRHQFHGFELADCEPIEPSLTATRQTMNLRAPHVPELDVDAV
jgi:hypothetical protein